MTSRQPARTRRPTLPCLTIARSPANDVRVIVNAFASTPALAGLLTDRAGFVGEHRAELRELLQQLTARIGAWIESAERSTADDHPRAQEAHGFPVLAAARAAAAGAPPATTSAPPDAIPGRPAARRRHAVHRAASTPAASLAEWRGGALLR